MTGRCLAARFTVVTSANRLQGVNLFSHTRERCGVNLGAKKRFGCCKNCDPKIMLHVDLQTGVGFRLRLDRNIYGRNIEYDARRDDVGHSSSSVWSISS